MKYAARRYNFITKDPVLKRYSILFEGVASGFPSGSSDIKSLDLKGLRTESVPQRKFGERPLSVWLKRFSPLEKNWSLTEHAVLPSLASGQRSSIGNLNKERFEISQLSPLLPKFSLVMERQVELRPKEIAIASLTLTLRQRRWETSIRQTLLDPDTSEVQKALPDSIPFMLWMWQGIRLSQVSFLINRPFLFASIWLKHGDIWGFPRYPRWIMRWLPQVEDAILTASRKLFAFIYLWEYIWYLSHRENQGEMPLLKVLINSGRKGCLEDIIVLPLLPLKEPVNDFCGITIMRNHTGVLSRKTTVQDSQGYSEIETGNISGICQKDSTLLNTLTPLAILISLLQRERSPLSERLTLMVKLRSMVLPISSGENLKGNMLLLLSLLIERDWLLNKRIKSSSLSLSPLRVVLLLLCFQLQRGRLNLVIDVITLLSIKNQLAMLLVQSISH